MVGPGMGSARAKAPSLALAGNQLVVASSWRQTIWAPCSAARSSSVRSLSMFRAFSGPQAIWIPAILTSDMSILPQCGSERGVMSVFYPSRQS